MERLTTRHCGVAVIKDKSFLKEAMEKLAKYENFEERLEKSYGECDGILECVIDYLVKHEGIDIGSPARSRLLTDEAVDEWEKYKATREHGMNLNIPCQSGDVIWDVYLGFPSCDIITGFSYGKLNEDNLDDLEVFDQIVIYYKTRIGGITGRFSISEFGKTVFFTKEEAEQALVRMEGENEKSNS